MRSLVLVPLLSSLACASAATSGATGPDTKTNPASSSELSEDLKAKACSAEDVDETSEIYLAFDASGALHRVVVTPSHDIADMGELVLDTNGALLGHTTGGEFPWDDEEVMKEENARVATLMDGAKVPDGFDGVPCSD